MPVKSRYRREKEKREAWEKFDKLDTPRFLRGKRADNSDLLLPDGYEAEEKAGVLNANFSESRTSGRAKRHAEQLTRKIQRQASIRTMYGNLIDGNMPISSAAQSISKRTGISVETLRRDLRELRGPKKSK